MFGNTYTIIISNFSTSNPINMEFQKENKPFGKIIKHQNRLCVYGGMQQQGIGFYHKFSSVINWSTVRLTIILAEIAGLESITIDCVLAFFQAPMGSDVIFIYQQDLMQMTKTKMKHIF